MGCTHFELRNWMHPLAFDELLHNSAVAGFIFLLNKVPNAYSSWLGPKLILQPFLSFISTLYFSIVKQQKGYHIYVPAFFPLKCLSPCSYSPREHTLPLLWDPAWPVIAMILPCRTHSYVHTACISWLADANTILLLGRLLGRWSVECNIEGLLTLTCATRINR